jgi:hypothetical protein
MRSSFTAKLVVVLFLGATAISVSACSGGGDGSSTNSGGDGGAGGGAEGGTGGGGGTPAPGTFGAKCAADKECTSGTDTCVFSSSRGGSGFCSKPCDAVADCPAQYDCENIGGAARKYCVPEDHLADCKTGCDSYDFFKCLTPGSLQKCYAACESASVSTRKSFAGCSGMAVDCDANCAGTLASDGASWIMAMMPKDPCTRSTTFDLQCKGMGLPAKGYQCQMGKQPTQTGCESLPVPDAYCCAN